MYGLLGTSNKRWKYDGLTSLKYEVLSDIKHPLYRRIKVKLEEPDPKNLKKLTEISYWKNEKYKYKESVNNMGESSRVGQSETPNTTSSFIFNALSKLSIGLS